MTEEFLLRSKRVAGIKQVKKALKHKEARELFLASDADPSLLAEIKEIAAKDNIPVHLIETMGDLGKACGIAVGAAAVAVLNETC